MEAIDPKALVWLVALLLNSFYFVGLDGIIH